MSTKLPEIERKPDGTPCRMTLAQRKRSNSLICRECCNYDNGNCLLLDDGNPKPARRRFRIPSAANGSAGRFCRWTRLWKRRFFTAAA